MGNLFELGHLVATPGVLEQLTLEEIIRCVERHVTGDWRELPPEDAAMNRMALKDGSRIFSSFVVRGVKTWVITEAVSSSDESGPPSRGSTCVLLPSEY